MTSSTIVTMTMASHSSHATAVTTSTIPVGEPLFIVGASWMVRVKVCSVLKLDRVFILQLKSSLSLSPTLHRVCSPTTQEKDPTSSPWQATGHPRTP